MKNYRKSLDDFLDGTGSDINLWFEGGYGDDQLWGGDGDDFLIGGVG